MMNKKSHSDGQMFEVISHAKTKKISESERVLPAWLSKPTKFSSANIIEHSHDIDEFSQYIDDDLRRHLKKGLKMEKFFPVQMCLIPHLSRILASRMFLRPNDICVSSPTGSGKTMAYVVPIVNHYKNRIVKSLKVLVILPVRDLAVQVHKAFSQVCEPTSLQVGLAVSESYSRPDDKPYNILVATPGTLVDHLQKCPGFGIEDIEVLVIDEADRLMNNNRHDWLRTVETSIFKDPLMSNINCACHLDDAHQLIGSKKRLCLSGTNGCSLDRLLLSRPVQKLLFSATLSSDPQLLLHMNLFQPRLFVASKQGSGQPSPDSLSVTSKNELLTSSTIPDQLEEKMFILEPKKSLRAKLFVMWYLLHQLKYRRVICFVNQVETSNRLCKYLNQIPGVKAAEFSSNMKADKREKYLADFSSDNLDVLVSSDMMARGMDVDNVDYVISYDVPSSEIYYVHRVGRTARAGKTGTAITLVQAGQLLWFKKIVQLAHVKPNSMRLNDVVEEMKIPQNILRDQSIQELFNGTVENFQDQVLNRRPRKAMKV